MATISEKRQTFKVNTRGEAAYFFGVSQTTIKTWEASGCPGKGRGGYDLRSMILWARENVWRQRNSADGIEGSESEPESEASLRKEKLRLENERKRIDIDERKGKLVSKAAILADQTRQNAIIRSRVESIPGEIASVVSPKERGQIVSAVDHKVKLILKSLSEEE